MADVYTTSGEDAENVVVPAPQLQGLYIPGIDNPLAMDGFGVVTPWGGGATARRYGDYGISTEATLQDTQLRDIANALLPAEGAGISYDWEGLVGPQGPPGRDGTTLILHEYVGLNSSYLTALPHNIDQINDLGTAADKLIYTDAYNTYTDITWTERQPAGDTNAAWRKMASDSDGSHLIVVGDTGSDVLYTSADSGVTWTPRQPSGATSWGFSDVASDSDGSNLIVGYSGGRLWTSSDYGANWTERRPEGDVNGTWRAIASDSDGSHLVAGKLYSRLWTSSDSGVNWTERRPAGDTNCNWWAAASDSDGSHLIVGSGQVFGAGDGRLYTSANYGVNWTERQPAGDSDRNWRSVASDSDGSNLIAGDYNGRLWTSSDYGANWTERRPAGDTNRNWYDVASDSDGSHLIACSDLGRLWTSKDYGVTWTEEQPAGTSSYQWEGVSIDSDGSHLIAGIFGGRLYTGIESELYSEATWAEADLTSAGRNLLDDADTATQRTTLGLAIGTNVQAWDAQLDDIAALAVTDGNVIVGDGANWVAESGNTARTSIGLGTGDTPTFNQVTLGVDPTNVDHAVTRSYADALVVGAFWEDVAVGTIANVNLASELEAGDTIDDYTLVEGDRVLVKSQTDETQNGLYVVPASGAASRATDADSAAEIENHKCIPLNGTVTQHHLYFCITGNITLGVTNIKFAEVSQVAAHNTLSGIQGGTSDQYYHLTNSEHTELNAWLDDVTLSNGGAMNLGTGALTAANYTAANLLTACTTNAGGLDFSAASKTLTVEDNATVSQDYSSDADVTFNDLTLSTPSNIYSLSHDSFADFVANEHIDHTSVTLTAGTGLTGGGDISSNRTFAVDGLLEDLDTLGACSADGEFLVGTGAGTLAWESGADARTSIGLGTGDTPEFTGCNIGTGELTCGSINRAADTLTLEIGGTAEISITSTTVTLGGNLIIPDSGTIGSASDTDVMTIDASGNCTFSVFPITPSAAPDADYEVANKKYVDDNVGTAFSVVLTPQCGIPPASSFATFDTIAGGSTPAEAITVLDFDASSSEYMDFKFVLPAGYGSGGLTVTIIFSMTSDHDEGTPHQVRWEVGFARVSDDDLDLNGDQSYDTNGVSATVPSEIGEVSYDSITFTDGADMDSLAAGEMAILRIYRDHDHADDDATGDAELHAIIIKET